MTTLLAVETSGIFCSLAIHVDGRWFEDTQKVERLHNRVVLGNLDALVRRAGSGRRFELVAFGAGPGSFTGIRIAAAVAQGVAYGCAARVVPVSSSLTLAAAARRGTGAGVDGLPRDADRLLTVTRSRRDAYYLAGYRLAADGTPEPWIADALHLGPDAPDALPQCPGVGDRPPWWPRAQPFVDAVAADARTVGELALAEYRRGAGRDPQAALPIYVSGDSPWQPMSS